MIQTFKIPVFNGDKEEEDELVMEYDSDEEYITVYLGKKYICGIGEIKEFKKILKELLLGW